MLCVLSLLLALASLASSTSITVLNPLDNQLPPIARVGKDYRWTFSAYTFGTCDDIEDYTTSSLPKWLSFDENTRTFSGTPSESDQGSPDVTVTAHGCSSSASSWFNIHTTSDPPPTLHTSIDAQFKQSNPSLSSVFTLSPNSALATDHPALRIPEKWSFSIGFVWDTFTGPGGIYYDVRQADGCELPDWVRFSRQSLTLDGVTPAAPKDRLYHLALHASEADGYTAETIPFDLIVASHEVTIASALPTINATAGSSFAFALSSAADFVGILIDGAPLQPANISDLRIDTSEFSGWLKYDSSNRSLIGTPGSHDLEDTLSLPVTLTTTFDQTVHTNVSVAPVPSYFTSETIPPYSATKGEVSFSLGKYFSNNSVDSERVDINVTASYEPSQAAEHLSYNSSTAMLTGHFADTSNDVTVTFIAFSQLTFSTSHASMKVHLSGRNEDSVVDGAGLSPSAHRALILALAISFGVIGGICLLGTLFAVIRRGLRVEDTAVTSEEGRAALSRKDKEYYGFEKSPTPQNPFDGSEQRHNDSDMRQFLDATTRFPRLGAAQFRNLGLSRSRSGGSPQVNNSQNSSVISKGEFFGRLRDTVRHYSDSYRRRRKPLNLSGPDRPVIGKPILIVPKEPTSFGAAFPDPFDDLNRVKSPSLVHFADLSRQVSAESTRSVSSDRTHAAEAVVQMACKQSVRSGKTASIKSDLTDASRVAATARPRLVPFTSASRVPVPQMHPSSPEAGPSAQKGKRVPPRVVSQKVTIHTDERSSSADDLDVSMRYTQALAAEDDVAAAPSMLTVSTNVRSSYSSLESSHQGHEGSEGDLEKVMAKVGSRVNFRVALRSPSPAVSCRHRALQARKLEGGPIPRFMNVDLGTKHRGWVQVVVQPSAKDVGQHMVGVYTVEDGLCVAKVCVTVLPCD